MICGLKSLEAASRGPGSHPDRVRHVYEDPPSYQLIDSNLARGNPVIVRVRFSSGVTHFVVIAGKQSLGPQRRA